MPKTERVGIGQKVDIAFLSTLELTFRASYLPPAEKVILLGKAISQLDVLKFFLQLAWEAKNVSNGRFAELISLLEEVGRMLGGWRKGLLNKTPPA